LSVEATQHSLGKPNFSRKLKALTGKPAKRENSDMKKKVTILNIDIDNLSRAELLGQLDYGIVFTPNVDHLVKLQNNQDFIHAYGVADYKVCDSKILLYFSQFLGTPLKEKISGSDLLPAFCNYHQANNDIKIFLLGGAEGVAHEAQAQINHRVKRDIVIASHSPSYGFEQNEAECLEIVQMINQSGATVLAIGVGAPKQEIWISKYKDQLQNIRIFLAIGAAIDFEAGNKQRSPRWMSEAGLEWLHRLLCEPKRLWKRYLMDDIPFIWLILMQKLGAYKQSSKED
jgi:exopolysaccharide biosynthesis WecB/TagA/CpsF family protein